MPQEALAISLQAMQVDGETDEERQLLLAYGGKDVGAEGRAEVAARPALAVAKRRWRGAWNSKRRERLGISIVR